jgi:hypothetical protein
MTALSFSLNIVDFRQLYPDDDTFVHALSRVVALFSDARLDMAKALSGLQITSAVPAKVMPFADTGKAPVSHSAPRGGESGASSVDTGEAALKAKQSEWTLEKRAAKKAKAKKHHELMQAQAHEAAVRRKERRIAAHELRMAEQKAAAARRLASRELAHLKKVDTQKSDSVSRREDSRASLHKRYVEGSTAIKARLMAAVQAVNAPERRLVMSEVNKLISAVPRVVPFKVNGPRLNVKLPSYDDFARTCMLNRNARVDTSFSKVYEQLTEMSKLVAESNERFAQFFFEKPVRAPLSKSKKPLKAKTQSKKQGRAPLREVW